MINDTIKEQTLPTRKIAEEVAKMIGCVGSHRVDTDSWGPCESSEDLTKLIRLGAAGFREWKKNNTSKKDTLGFLLLNKKAVSFDTEQQASAVARLLRCEGSHRTENGMFSPCASPAELAAFYDRPSKKRRRNQDGPIRRVISDKPTWDNLNERPIRGIAELPTGGLVSTKASMSDSFAPTAGMVVEAQRGLSWRRQHGRGGTMVGVARARDISNNRDLSYRTVKRMKAYFDRHAVDADATGFRPGEDGYPSNGRIAWALWGGDDGYTWAKSIVERVEGSSKAFSSLVDVLDFQVRYKTEAILRGWSLGDGSYLIKDEFDLAQAVNAYIKSGGGDNVREHILRRARALGKVDLVPAEFKVSARRLNYDV